jgi:tyrosyl-tRNA synthetase
VSEDVPVMKIGRSAEGLAAAEDEVKMAKLLVLAGLAASAGEATRKLAENAVSVNGEKFSGKVIGTDALGDTPILRLGKKSVRVEWAQ